MALKSDVKKFYRDLFDILEHGYLEENPAEVLESVENTSGERYPEPMNGNVRSYTVAVSEIQSEMVEHMMDNGYRNEELELLEGNFRDIMHDTLNTNSYSLTGFYRKEELFQSGRLISIVPDYLDLDLEPSPRLNPYNAILEKDPHYEDVLFDTAESIAVKITSTKEKKRL